MIQPMSITVATQNYRLSAKTNSFLLSNDSESWFASTAFVADVVCRDKIMSVITNPHQMGIFTFYKSLEKNNEFFLKYLMDIQLDYWEQFALLLWKVRGRSFQLA